VSERPRRRRPVAGGTVESTDRPPRTILGKRYRGRRELGQSGAVGLEIALSIVLPLLLGNWLDGRWGTGPWLAAVGFALGLATAVRALLRAMAAMKKVAEKEEAEMGNPAPLYPDEKARRDDFPEASEDSDSGEGSSS